MKKKFFFIITCGLTLTLSINFMSGNQTWSNYLRLKWTEFNNSSYTRLIPQKTLSYVLPAMTVVPGAVIGRMIAENKFLQQIPEDPLWARIISRRNYEIVRSWGIIGGLATLAAYKIISSYYQQPPASNDGNEQPSEK